MHIPTAILGSSAVLTAVVSAAVNTTREYNLRSYLKPNQPGKERYDNLWLSTYHIGAGQSDVVFVSKQANTTAVGFLSPSNVTTTGSDVSYSQAFDLGNTFAWQFGIS